MPQILDRDFDHSSRYKRLAKQKKGPGVFIYDGKAMHTEWEPTLKRVGKSAPALDPSGMPLLDASGRQQYLPPNQLEYDEKGQPKLGGPPKVTKTPIEVYMIRRMEFPAGKRVKVADAALALKLRCIGFFEEVEGAADEPESADEAPPDHKPLGKMSKGELLDLAGNEGIEVPDGATKAELLEILEKAQAES